MELDKELCVAMMLGVVSEMSLEGKSLEWLKKTRAEQSRIVADCERSAREIREYVITEYNGRDGASELVKERKAELVEAIERQAEMVQVLVKRIDDEIGNREYKTEKEDKGMEREEEKRDYSQLSVLELINKLLELRYKLKIIKLANKLRLWDKGAYTNVDALTDELTEHIDVLGAMKAVCEEMLRAVCDKEFDE